MDRGTGSTVIDGPPAQVGLFGGGPGDAHANTVATSLETAGSDANVNGTWYLYLFAFHRLMDGIAPQRNTDIRVENVQADATDTQNADADADDYFDDFDNHYFQIAKRNSELHLKGHLPQSQILQWEYSLAHLIQGKQDPGNLGIIARLSLEIRWMIFREIDLKSLLAFSQLNKAAAWEISGMLAWQDVLSCAPDVIRMAIGIGTAHLYTIGQVSAALKEDRCTKCGKLAPYFDVFTLELRCISVGGGCDPRATTDVIFMTEEERETAEITQNELLRLKIPNFRPLPGIYCYGTDGMNEALRIEPDDRRRYYPVTELNRAAFWVAPTQPTSSHVSTRRGIRGRWSSSAVSVARITLSKIGIGFCGAVLAPGGSRGGTVWSRRTGDPGTFLPGLRRACEAHERGARNFQDHPENDMADDLEEDIEDNLEDEWLEDDLEDDSEDDSDWLELGRPQNPISTEHGIDSSNSELLRLMFGWYCALGLASGMLGFKPYVARSEPFYTVCYDGTRYNGRLNMEWRRHNTFCSANTQLPPTRTSTQPGKSVRTAQKSRTPHIEFPDRQAQSGSTRGPCQTVCAPCAFVISIHFTTYQQPYTITQIHNSTYAQKVGRNVTQAALPEVRRYTLHAYFTGGNPSSPSLLGIGGRNAGIAIEDRGIFKSYDGARRKLEALVD
ncbi:hypothetical protein BU23DRAFT_570453 [Bimuria novae-zelandiae CBS 107.79]|uniref:F-box domain-containing protein n=1 Tax=Bimuria novae-zelandiae CBS 107.79 TaxID=1447943 RepID=A0A6A5V027_9PLEO|nr:hypothetical protein BU23DRAFT_570453 [Bimuria novae-zelandiae CBS 107.79]